MQARDYRYFDTPFAALAHRGGALLPANLGRENSVHAFTQAIALGYRYLETDVHSSSDGVLLAFHDDELDRVTDGTGLVSALPWSELQQARIGGVDPIPTLDELLETFPDARFNIDLKDAGAIEPLARAIETHRAQDRVCVASFSTRRLRAFRRLMGTRVPTAAGPVGVAAWAWKPGLRRLLHSPGVALQLPERVWRDRLPLLSRSMVRAAHAAGRVVHVWTVNDRPTMERLIDLGVDGLVSDRIDLLARVLTERGLWEGGR